LKIGQEVPKAYWEATKKRKAGEGGSNDKIGYSTIFFSKASQMLCSRPRIGSSFYPTVSLAYLD